MTAVNGDLEKVSKHLQEIEDDFTLATERVENLVLSEAIGLALRQQFEQTLCHDHIADPGWTDDEQFLASSSNHRRRLSDQATGVNQPV